jgi:hypothetical protein
MVLPTQIGDLFPNGLNEHVTYTYVFGLTLNTPQINQWPLSFDVNGCQIRKNPVSGAELHYDGNGVICRLQMVGPQDSSLDGIFNVFEIMGAADKHVTYGEPKLMVSQCSPVFFKVEGTTTLYHVYTMSFIRQLYNNSGVVPGRNFIIEMPGGIRTNAW